MDEPRSDKLPQPPRRKGSNPWEGLSPKERARRIAKMKATREAKRIMSTPGRRTFDRAEKAAYVVKVDELIATGMMVKDACAQVGIGQSQYRDWGGKGRKVKHKPNGKHLPVVVGRPAAHEIEVLEIPAPLARAAAHVNGGSRLDRLAALIVAVEKLL